MSMPTFPECGIEITQEQAFNMLLGSIAMEELGLSHILNAEGEKLQYVLGTLPGSKGLCATTGEILQVNRSVTELLEQVSHNQLLLKGKLEHLLRAKECWNTPKPAPPCPPAAPACPRPLCMFCETKSGIWHAGQGFCWKPCYTQGEACCRQGCFPALVYPPPNSAVLLHYRFTLTGERAEQTRISLDRVNQNAAETFLCCEETSCKINGRICLAGSTLLPPEACPLPLRFTLCEPQTVEVVCATLSLVVL